MQTRRPMKPGHPPGYRIPPRSVRLRRANRPRTPLTAPANAATRHPGGGKGLAEQQSWTYRYSIVVQRERWEPNEMSRSAKSTVQRISNHRGRRRDVARQTDLPAKALGVQLFVSRSLPMTVCNAEKVARQAIALIGQPRTNGRLGGFLPIALQSRPVQSARDSLYRVGLAFRRALLVALIGQLLFAHGCHGDEDHELFSTVAEFSAESPTPSPSGRAAPLRATAPDESR